MSTFSHPGKQPVNYSAKVTFHDAKVQSNEACSLFWVAVLQPHSCPASSRSSKEGCYQSMRLAIPENRWPRAPPTRQPAWQILEKGNLASRMNPPEGFQKNYCLGNHITNIYCFHITKLDKMMYELRVFSTQLLVTRQDT